MLDIDFKNTADVKRLRGYVEAKHITVRLLDVLHDYYDGSGVEIHNETNLSDLLTDEIQRCLNDLD